MIHHAFGHAVMQQDRDLAALGFAECALAEKAGLEADAVDHARHFFLRRGGRQFLTACVVVTGLGQLSRREGLQFIRPLQKVVLHHRLVHLGRDHGFVLVIRSGGIEMLGTRLKGGIENRAGSVFGRIRVVQRARAAGAQGQHHEQTERPIKAQMAGESARTGGRHRQALRVIKR